MFNRDFLRKFSRFIYVGATATLLQYAILLILVEALGFSPVLASAIGFAISAIANYLLNRHFTFRSTLSHRITAVRFVVAVLCGLAVTFLLMLLLTDSGMNYVASQILTTTIVLLLNFIAGSHWTFK